MADEDDGSYVSLTLSREETKAFRSRFGKGEFDDDSDEADNDTDPTFENRGRDNGGSLGSGSGGLVNISAAMARQQTTEEPLPTNAFQNAKRKRDITPDLEALPWMKGVSIDPTQDPVKRLHDEIRAFYDFVRPTDYEQRVREFVLQRIERALLPNGLFVGGEVRTFGSFPTGLYLPTGDIDVCVLTEQFVDSGVKQRERLKGQANNLIREAIWCLDREVESAEHISKARVPLYKFRHAVTKINIDLSANNDGGIRAVDTVRRWAAAWPAMAPLLMVLKQLLKMRRLNDNATQGLGSFALICLLVNFLRHHPAQQNPLHPDRRNSVKAVGYGELLLGFLLHYGEEFDRRAVCIKMHESNWGYYPKTKLLPERGPKDKFSIFDPHDNNRDISSGTLRAGEVARAFLNAYKMLKNVMMAPGFEGSILGEIIGGDYTPYTVQRNRLHRLDADIQAGTLTLISPLRSSPYHASYGRGGNSRSSYGRSPKFPPERAKDSHSPICEPKLDKNPQQAPKQQHYAQQKQIRDSKDADTYRPRYLRGTDAGRNRNTEDSFSGKPRRGRHRYNSYSPARRSPSPAYLGPSRRSRSPALRSFACSPTTPTYGAGREFSPDARGTRSISPRYTGRRSRSPEYRRHRTPSPNPYSPGRYRSTNSYYPHNRLRSPAGYGGRQSTDYGDHGGRSPDDRGGRRMAGYEPRRPDSRSFGGDRGQYIAGHDDQRTRSPDRRRQ